MCTIQGEISAREDGLLLTSRQFTNINNKLAGIVDNNDLIDHLPPSIEEVHVYLLIYLYIYTKWRTWGSRGHPGASTVMCPSVLWGVPLNDDDYRVALWTTDKQTRSCSVTMSHCDGDTRQRIIAITGICHEITGHLVSVIMFMALYLCSFSLSSDRPSCPGIWRGLH